MALKRLLAVGVGSTGAGLFMALSARFLESLILMAAITVLTFSAISGSDKVSLPVTPLLRNTVLIALVLGGLRLIEAKDHVTSVTLAYYYVAALLFAVSPRGHLR